MVTKNVLSLLSILGAVTVVALSGCANGIPKGSLTYYLPKAETTLTVTQTLTCNATGDEVLQVVTVNPSTVYSSDTDHVVTITPRNISGTLNDADISFSFTDDGRLSGVNTSTTGQGSTVVKDVLAVVKAAGLTAAAAPPAMNPKAACATIAALAPKGAKADAPPPSLTLTYTHSFGYDTSAANVQFKDSSGTGPTFNPEFDTDFASHTYFNALKKSIPQLGFAVEYVSAAKAKATSWAGADTSDFALDLNSLATVKLQVRGLKDDMKGVNREAIWSGEALVPLNETKDLIHVPIPKPVVFGQRKFSLTLASSGAITKIGYASTGVTDTADALSAIGSAVGATTKGSTVAQQAAAVQAQADLIFQQQRLATCKAKAESCSGK